MEMEETQVETTLVETPLEAPLQQVKVGDQAVRLLNNETGCNPLAQETDISTPY